MSKQLPAEEELEVHHKAGYLEDVDREDEAPEPEFDGAEGDLPEDAEDVEIEIPEAEEG
ncbi:hypothetical protein [Nesterenkonia jeotgali]|uniref:Uncharacterized protein n=1 Tax=Nesterenkonia jeotgali TaxID=317018 RepID=A0A839FP79_9MICC|nr:hypothetical protein [Nesterenkonia jeotgali]MBA8920451.1 hypothetical protein [Nesterenkonia jeotgali]